MSRTRNYPALDGLKGIFMFLIVFNHVLPELPAPTPILDAIPLTSFIPKFGGDLGNCMFFMLSGFVMSTGYQNRIRTHEIGFQDYFLKRLCKLYPIYILSNLVMLVLTVLEHGPSGFNLKRIAFTALIQLAGALKAHPYNGPSWFLSALFLCYILYYAITYFAVKPTHYAVSVALAIAIGYSMISGSLNLPFCSTGNGTGIMSFFLGCALKEFYPAISQKYGKWLPAASFFVLALSAFLLLRYGVEIIAGETVVAFAFVICPLTLYLALDGKLVSWFLRSKPLQALGKLSMSVYFWHYPVFTAMRYGYLLLGRELTETQLPFYLVLMFLCSIASYCFIEKHNISRKASPAQV